MAVDLNDLKIRHEEGRSGVFRWIFWAIPAVVVIAGAVVLGYELMKHGSARAEGPEIQIAAAAFSSGGGPSPRSFTAGGWVEPAFPWPVVISALTEGRIEKILVQEGDEVEKGALVAALYDGDLADEVKRAEASLKVALAKLALLEAGYRKEDVAEARAVLSELKAQESLAGKVAERSKTLAADGVVSVEQAERDEAALSVASARVGAQEARLALLEAGPRKEEIDEAAAVADGAKWQLELARKKLSYAEVRAPVKGRVLKLLTDQGRKVTADKPFVASLYDPADLWVRVDVAQSDVGTVRKGQEVEVRVQAASERVFGATVVRVDPAADFAKNTITVRVELSPAEGPLHPDMTAKISFPAPDAPKAGKDRGRLMIPRVAVVRQGDSAFVFEIVEGTAHKRAVKLGGTLGDAVEVLEGLSEGAPVAISGLAGLTDGAKVKPKAR